MQNHFPVGTCHRSFPRPRLRFRVIRENPSEPPPCKLLYLRQNWLRLTAGCELLDEKGTGFHKFGELGVDRITVFDERRPMDGVKMPGNHDLILLSIIVAMSHRIQTGIP